MIPNKISETKFANKTDIKKGLVFISRSPDETQLFAQKITNKLLTSNKQHIFFLLEGELGIGKTQFVKGVAKKLNLPPKKIHSPTFVFITDFVKKNIILYHIDFYRIEKKFISKILIDHIEEIQNYSKTKTVTCIEWANKINKKIILQLAKENIDIIFTKIKMFLVEQNFRKIVLDQL